MNVQPNTNQSINPSSESESDGKGYVSHFDLPNSKYYGCEECTNRYTTTSALSRHCRNKHGKAPLKIHDGKAASKMRKEVRATDRRLKSALIVKNMQYCMATIVRKRFQRLFDNPGAIGLALPEMDEEERKRYEELVLNEAATMCYVKEDRILKAMYRKAYQDGDLDRYKPDAGIGNITLSDHSDSESDYEPDKNKK